MAIESWGFRHVIVDHRPLVHLWVRRDDGCDEYYASPGPFRDQLREAGGVASAICDGEAFYEHLVSSGLYTNLDDIDQECRRKFGRLQFSTPRPARIHD